MTLTTLDSAAYVLARMDSWTYPEWAVATLGQNITRLRLQGGHHNAAKFARAIGITATTLNDWESGRYRNLRLDSLLRLARGLPCTMEDLLTGVDEAYDKIVIEKKAESPTPAGLDPGVQENVRVRNTYADAPQGSSHHADVAAPIRSSLDLAARLSQQAADLHTHADTILGFAHQLTDRFGDELIGPPREAAGLHSPGAAAHPTAKKRSPRRRGGAR